MFSLCSQMQYLRRAAQFSKRLNTRSCLSHSTASACQQITTASQRFLIHLCSPRIFLKIISPKVKHLHHKKPHSHVQMAKNALYNCSFPASPCVWFFACMSNEKWQNLLLPDFSAVIRNSIFFSVVNINSLELWSGYFASKLYEIEGNTRVLCMCMQ